MLTVRVARARAIGRLTGGTSGPTACHALTLASRVDYYRAEEAAMALIRHGPQALSQRDPFGDWLFDWPDLFRGFEPLRPLLAGQLQVEEFIDGGKLVIRVELPGIDPTRTSSSP